MNEKRIAVGIAAWFLGIVVPVYHHVALHAAIAHVPFNNDILRMRWVWDFIPWVEWLYVVIMWAVGLILIVTGMLHGRSGARSDEPRTPGGPRGFEVITESELRAER